MGVQRRPIARRRGLDAESHRRRALLVADDGLIGGAAADRFAWDVIVIDNRHVLLLCDAQSYRFLFAPEHAILGRQIGIECLKGCDLRV
jgi:hypothetical protein